MNRIVTLMRCQTHDPDRGSFVVDPAPKKHKGRPVKHKGLPVYRDKIARDSANGAGLEYIVIGE